MTAMDAFLGDAWITLIFGQVGGTWYWNRYANVAHRASILAHLWLDLHLTLSLRYPGAMSDTNSHIYRYSWDQDLLLNYPFPEHYVKQPEILRYLNYVVDRYDLRKNFLFNTEMVSIPMGRMVAPI